MIWTELAEALGLDDEDGDLSHGSLLFQSFVHLVDGLRNHIPFCCVLTFIAVWAPSFRVHSEVLELLREEYLRRVPEYNYIPCLLCLMRRRVVASKRDKVIMRHTIAATKTINQALYAVGNSLPALLVAAAAAVDEPVEVLPLEPIRRVIRLALKGQEYVTTEHFLQALDDALNALPEDVREWAEADENI